VDERRGVADAADAAAQDAGETADGAEAVGATTDETQAVTVLGVDAAQHAQELLAEHVPLTLLVDLLAPTGQSSDDLLAAEGLPDDAWWTPPVDGDARGA